jgi:ADP-heptose:LPS heptosyltransferase
MDPKAINHYPDVRRVLIYRLGSLGDTVVALPALHQVANAFPNAKRLMLTNKPVHAKAPAASAVLGDSGLVHGYLSYPVGTRNVRELLALWWQIRRFRPEWVVYLTKYRGDRELRRDETFFRLCGVSNITGVPHGELSTPQYLPQAGLWEREGARLLRCVSHLGDAAIDDLSLWDMHLTPAETTKASGVLASLQGAPFLACGPGTKAQAKDWGEENWRELLHALSFRLPGAGLVMIGAKEDGPVSDIASAGWSGPVVNLCGALSPRETAAVLQHAKCFVGPDSGPMHLAAAYGVPCVIAFASRTRPGIWFPIGEGHRILYRELECSNCNLEVCVERQKKCLTSISVEEMLQAVLAVWPTRN